jgi:hypothetical protein
VNLRRLEALSAPEAGAAAGLALIAAGLAALADALVQAAPSSDLDTADRLAYGLWSVRLEHGAAFTIGLGLAVWAFAGGARLAGWREPALRLTAGLAYGLAALAAVVLVASTYVALRGHVGSGFALVHLSGRARTFTWLRQAVTAAGFGAAWTLAGARLGRFAREPLEEPALEPAAAPPAAVPAPQQPGPQPPEPQPPAPLPATAPEPQRVAPVVPIASQERHDPRTPPTPVPGTQQAAGTLSRRARDTYRSRLAYSRRGPEARELADRIERLERDGQIDEAARLLAQLEAL